MNTDLKKLLSNKESNILANLSSKYDLSDDSELFVCYNEEFIDEAQFPHVIPGNMVKDKVLDKYYRIEYYGPNPSPKRKLIADEAMEKVAKAKEQTQAAMKQVSQESEPIEAIETPAPAIKVKKKKGAIIE